ncbi:hypothetical protein [Maridesulfovibrio sp.]|uniref:hypothetical protein n=1 Tax=Maridesulfovibrio sp. TaxID=2795000 RepID=UPI002AA6B735|nr:hypothetical protein [Maridesulfovibrio sp.]
MADTYTPYGSNNTTAQNVVNSALNKAQSTLNGMKTPAYPTYTGDQKQGPTQMNYYQQTQAPQYQTTGPLMGGDYDALQKAYEQPAYDAYGKAIVNTQNVFGNNGMYGSVGNNLMSDAMGYNQRALNTGLSDAVAQRYKMQQTDMDRMRQENENVAKFGLMNAQRQDDFNKGKLAWDYGQAENQRNWTNGQIDSKFAYDLAQKNWDMTGEQRIFDNSANLAAGAGSSANAQMQAQANQYAADRNYDAVRNTNSTNSSNGWLGAAGAGLGAVAGSDWFGDWMSGLFN